MVFPQCCRSMLKCSSRTRINEADMCRVVELLKATDRVQLRILCPYRNYFMRWYGTQHSSTTNLFGQKTDPSHLYGVLGMRKWRFWSPLAPISLEPRGDANVRDIERATATTAITYLAGRATHCRKRWIRTVISTVLNLRRRVLLRGIYVSRHRRCRKRLTGGWVSYLVAWWFHERLGMRLLVVYGRYVFTAICELR